MKVEDLLDLMSKSNLEKIVKSFTTGYYQKDEEGYREQIKSNIDHLGKPETIKASLKSSIANSKKPYQQSLLIQFVLEAFLRSESFNLEEPQLIESVISMENEVIEKSKNEESYRHISSEAQSMFQVLLEVALEDASISEDEMHLIKAVRKKLKMHQQDHYLIQAKIQSFPQENNEVHSHEDIQATLNELQKAGVVFYANKMNPKSFVLPDELIHGVKQYLGIELIEHKFYSLLDSLLTSELKSILNHLNLKQSGVKEELIHRILLSGIQPSEVLGLLGTNRLAEICKSLPEIKVSGTKDERIERIIQHYDKLTNLNSKVTEDEREVYYDFFEYLGKMDMANLLSKKIVKNESEAAKAFEKATHFLFETKLNHAPLKQEGSEHADGCLQFNSKGDLMLWDNKAKMSDNYSFPNDHFRQFKRYIRDLSNYGKRVNCFLIIASDIDESSKENALRLKYESGSDTDIALISTSNLKWLAEYWFENNPEKPINLEVFNFTGILDKEEIKARLKVFK